MEYTTKAGIKVTIDDKEAGVKLNELKQKLNSLYESQEKMRLSNDKAGFDRVTKEIKGTLKETKSLESAINGLDNVMKNLSGATMNQLIKAKRQIQKELKNLERGTAEYIAKLKQLNAVESNLASARKDLAQFNGEAQKTSGTFSSMKLGIMAALAAIAGFTAGLMKIVEVRAQFEKFEAVLTNTLGSKSAARKALDDITKFAAVTPYQVDELTDSFIKLANRGMVLTMDQMRSIGDTAASTGKSFGQLTEAILDINNPERWKEIGIKAETTGNKVKLSFKGMTQEVDRTEAGVMKAITAFGKMQGVSGMMAAISTTMEGQLSNMKDAWTNMLNAIGDRLSPALKSGMAMLQSTFATIQDWAKVPVSTKIMEEQEGLNSIVQTMMSLKEGTAEWNRLRDELIRTYPEFLGNLNAEKLTNEQLAKQLRLVNDQYELKIKTAVIQERLNEIMADDIRLKKEEDNINKDIVMYYNQLIDKKKEFATQEEMIQALSEKTSGGFGVKSGLTATLDKVKQLVIVAEAQKQNNLERLELEYQYDKESSKIKKDNIIKTSETKLTADKKTIDAQRKFHEESLKLRQEQQKLEIDLMAEGEAKELAILQSKTDNEIEELRMKLVDKETLTKEELEFNTATFDLITAKTEAANKEWFDIKKKYQDKWITETEKYSMGGDNIETPIEGDNKQKKAKLPEDKSVSGMLARLKTLKAGSEESKAVLQDLADFANQTAEQIGSSMGDIVGGVISSNEEMVKTGAKNILLFTLETIKKSVQMTLIGAQTKAIMESAATPQSAATFGIAGAIQAAATVALIEAAFQTFSATISSQLYTGGFTPPGDKYKPAGIVHAGEYVIPQEGVNNPTLTPFLANLERSRQNGTMREMNFSGINKSIENTRMMALGGYTSSSQQQAANNATTSTNDNGLAATIAQLNAQLADLQKNGINGVWQWDAYKKGIDKMDRIQKRVKG